MNFSPDSRFMRLCGSFVSLVRINLLWLLCSLPLFTVGASTAAMVSALTAFRADDSAARRCSSVPSAPISARQPSCGC
ncbi:MAG: DUF624 domain-containing protein [Oscillospiraceae bacterium]